MVSTRGVKFKFAEGERVLCYEPDTTKARVLYDSKVLELNVERDSRGRKVPEYLIHFYGWSSSWDRCVKEDLILPDTEENRALQAKLASDAALSLKRGRKVKVASPAKETVKKEPPEDVKEIPAPAKAEVQSPPPSSASESSEEDVDHAVVLDIPKPLKELMIEDSVYITQKDKLIKLPCELNVIDILEGYVRHLGNELINLAVQRNMKNGKEFTLQNAEDKIHYYKEVMDGIRVYFDFTLPHLLLYRQEKKQFYTAGNSRVPFCKFKGEKSEQQNSAGNMDTSDAGNTRESDSKTVSKSSGRGHVSGPKSPNSEDLSPSSRNTDRNQQKAKRLRSLGSRPGLRSSDKSKSSEDETTVTANNSSISGPDSDHSPTRPESPCTPTSPPRQTRQSSQTASAAPSNPNKSTSPTKRGTLTPLSMNNLCQQVLSVNISFLNTAATSASSSSPSNPPVPKVEKMLPCPLSVRMRNELQVWRMLPPYLYEQVPAAPSLIYGGQHLLRLFVKLPDLLYKSQMNQKKLRGLMNSFENFLKYLVEKKEELFIPCYIDSSEELRE